MDNKTRFENEVKKRCCIPTDRGECVQSEGERLIANFLYKHTIAYDYDKQITLRGIERNKQGYDTGWVRPDFYLTEFGIIIEYFGLEGNKEYYDQKERKHRLYKESGQRFIPILPKDLEDIESLLMLKLSRMNVIFPKMLTPTIIGAKKSYSNIKTSLQKSYQFSKENVKKYVDNNRNKKYRCLICGRPISHKGNCYACNIKKSLQRPRNGNR